jgi:hypothetical protein
VHHSEDPTLTWGRYAPTHNAFTNFYDPAHNQFLRPDVLTTAEQIASRQVERLASHSAGLLEKALQ